jgi:hypothetical protein
MQSELYSHILHKHILCKFEPLKFFNQRVERFRLPPTSFAAFCRVTNTLQNAPPKVHNALILTIFNGWCTARRFGDRARCPFCSIWSSDCDLTHIMTCPVVFALGHHFLGLPRSANKLAFFNLLEANHDTLKKRSVHLYVLKRTFDFLRHNTRENPTLTYNRYLFKFFVNHVKFVSSFRRQINLDVPRWLIDLTR